MVPSQLNKGIYNQVDNRYKLYETPKELEQVQQERIKEQAKSMACLVNKVVFC